MSIPRVLRDKLGEEATDAFIRVISEAGLDTRRDLATKEDISKLKEDMFKVETRLKENISKVKEDVAKTEARLKENIAETKAGLKEEISKTEAGLKGEISKLKEDITKTEVRLTESIAETKASLKEDISRVREDVAQIKGEMVLMKWLMGLILATLMSLVMKIFFMH